MHRLHGVLDGGVVAVDGKDDVHFSLAACAAERIRTEIQGLTATADAGGDASQTVDAGLPSLRGWWEAGRCPARWRRVIVLREGARSWFNLLMVGSRVIPRPARPAR